MNYTIAIKKQASKALANLPQDSYQKVRDIKARSQEIQRIGGEKSNSSSRRNKEQGERVKGQ